MNYQSIIWERLEMASPFNHLEGRQWYTDANIWCKEIANYYKVPVELVAGLTALFSPLKSWEINKRLTKGFLEEKTCPTFHYQRNKALKLWSEIISDLKEDQRDNYIIKTLNGRKTTSFYHNMMYPETSDKVTIDTHILYGLGEAKISPNKYNIIERSFQEVSISAGLKPHQLQAIVWLQVKDEKHNNKRNSSKKR